MLAFALFHDAPDACVLSQAHLFGPDDIAIAGRISSGKGLVLCDKPTRGNAGLALQVRVEAPSVGDAPVGAHPPTPAGELGQLMLATCLLPEREAPYLLSLELARRRIMLLLNKMEDWNLTDLPANDPIVIHFEHARRAFTEALVHQRTGADLTVGGFSPVADRLARQALAIGIDCGESLARRAAQRGLDERLSGTLHKRAIHAAEAAGEQVHPGAPIKNHEGPGLVLPSLPTIGCAVNPAVYSEASASALASACDYLTVPMRWIDMEPDEGTYSFAKSDKWIEWAVRTAKLPVAAGPIVDFGRSCVPKWLSIWENDYETLRELVYEHVRQIVTRYRRAVTRWTVASGLHVNDNFALPFERMVDLTRVCVLVVRKLHPQARIHVEVSHPWGEYHAVNKNAVAPGIYAETLAQAGIVIDALSVKIRMAKAAAGFATRDLMTLSDLLDRYAELERPIAVSLGVPSEAAANGSLEPGQWRGSWTPQRQADWLDAAATVCLGKPYVTDVCWQEACDVPEMLEMKSGGLIAADGSPKPALGVLRALRDRVRAARPQDRPRNA